MAKAGEAKSKYQVPNLERALAILEHLAERPEQASMADIARALRYPNNSVFRIVSTLEASGYVARDPESKRFGVTRKLLSLGYQALVETSLVEKSLDILRKLRDQVGETALLGVLLEGDGVVLDQALSREPIKFTISPGTRFQLHCAAPGKAMLAFLPEAERERQLSMVKYVRHTPNTIVTAAALLQELGRVRSQGFATDFGEGDEGVVCVGAPVFDYRGLPAAAIWVTGPVSRIVVAAAGSAVKSAAAELSARLGGASPKDEPCHI